MTPTDRRAGLCLLIGGSAMPLALAPFNFWPMAILSLATLSYFLDQQTPKRAFVRATCFNLGLFLSGVSWLYISIHEHGFVAAPLALSATLLFCAFMAIISSLPFLLWAAISPTWASGLLAFPALWMLGEWLRSWFLTGFPWLLIGYSHLSTWLGGWAPVGGVFWLSFITAMGGVCVAQYARGHGGQRPLTLCSLALLGCVGGGYGLLHSDWSEPLGAPLSVALVQPNIAQNQKWSADRRQQILTQLQQQSLAHWGRDLIVWPEAAVPANAQRVASFLSAMNDRAAASGSALVTGIPTRDNQGFHNSVLALGSASGQYDKTRLVPFGEYVPLQGLLRGAIAFFDLPMSNFSRGARYQPPLQVGERQLAVAICYEVVYPDLVARITADASMLLTVSNDAWFGDSLALPQHLQMAQMRAAENAKPLLRATNNGLTAIVDHRGRMVDSIAPFERGELTADIQPRSGRTPFSRWGSWPSIALCLVIICGLGLARQRQNGVIITITKP